MPHYCSCCWAGEEAEFEADLLGQELAAAGFDPVGAVMLMDYLLSIESEERSAGLSAPIQITAQGAARRLVNFGAILLG